MLSQSNIPVVEMLRKFRASGVSVAFLVPTQTGLHKSIMDATHPVRAYLCEKEIHNFEMQGQGDQHKAKVPTVLFSCGRFIQPKRLYIGQGRKKGIQEFGSMALPRTLPRVICWPWSLPSLIY